MIKVINDIAQKSWFKIFVKVIEIIWLSWVHCGDFSFISQCIIL